jgi:hypothetical protein
MTSSEMRRIFQTALLASGLLNKSTTSSPAELRDVVAAMGDSLRTQGADSFEQEFFREAIVRAVTCAPTHQMTDAERATAITTVYTAFDGLPRRTSALTTRTAFLREVTFVDESGAYARALAG